MSDIEVPVSECSYPAENIILQLQSPIPEDVQAASGGILAATCPFLNTEAPFVVFIDGKSISATCIIGKHVCEYNHT